MITLLISLVLIGFFSLYSSSSRAELTLQYSLQRWVHKNQKQGMYFGIFCMMLSIIVAIAALGTGAGIFAFLVVVMTIASLVILLSPLRVLRFSTLFLLIVICFSVEIMII